MKPKMISLILCIAMAIAVMFCFTSEDSFSQDIRHVYQNIGFEDFDLGIPFSEWLNILHSKEVYPQEIHFSHIESKLNPYILLYNKFHYPFLINEPIHRSEADTPAQRLNYDTRPPGYLNPDKNLEQVLLRIWDLPIQDRLFLFYQTDDDYFLRYNLLVNYQIKEDDLNKINEHLTQLQFQFYQYVLYKIKAELNLNLDQIQTLVHLMDDHYSEHRRVHYEPGITNLESPQVDTNPVYFIWQNGNDTLKLKLEQETEAALQDIIASRADEEYDNHSIGIEVSRNNLINEIQNYQRTSEDYLLLELARLVEINTRLIHQYLYQENLQNQRREDSYFLYIDPSIEDLE